MRHERGWPFLGPALCLAGALAFLLPVSATAGGRARRHGRRHVPTPVESILAQLDAINARLDDLYVPFKVEIPGGMCNSMAAPSANPKIIIDSDGADPFTVTSLIVKRGFQNPVDFLFLSVNEITINGTVLAGPTGNLFDPVFGQFLLTQGADIMGMPVRRGGDVGNAEPGGNLPHEIVAEGDSPEDVRVQLFCRSDERDLEIETVLVAGWKKPTDTITVTYIPGN